MATVATPAALEKAVPRPGLRGLARHEAKWGLIFLSPWIIGFLLFYLLPMAASLGFSLFEFNLVLPEESRFVGLRNWTRALGHDRDVPASFGRTFLFGAVSIPIGLISSLGLALVLNSRHLLGKDLFRTLFYMPTIIPLVAVTIIWSGVLNEQTGWLNLFLERVLGIKAIGPSGLRWFVDPRLVYFSYTMLGLWALGNAMLIKLAGLQSVPTELYDAAQVDGAGWWRQLWHITLPMISPVLFYSLTLGLIGLMQYFLVPFVLNAGNGNPNGMTRFVMVWFYKQAFGFFNMGYGAALAWLIFLVALGLTLLLFGSARYWVYYEGRQR